MVIKFPEEVEIQTQLTALQKIQLKTLFRIPAPPKITITNSHRKIVIFG